VLELERLSGLRVVADPTALDRAGWHGDGVLVLRLAPDEAFAIDAERVDIDDAHAIVEPEAGFAGAWLTLDALAALVMPHLEWALPSGRPALAQGSIAGVPGRLWLTEDGGLLLTAAAYADELTGRLR
jgi:hypothetical protein